MIFDLDGTITDLSHRKHYLDQDPPDWKIFNSLVYEDEINMWAERLIRMINQDKSHFMLIVSGRSEDAKYDTITWLKDHNIVYDALFMRKKNDSRRDDIIKEEIYNDLIKPHYQVQFVIDDRKRVVDMWRKNGLVCLQCAEGDY